MYKMIAITILIIAPLVALQLSEYIISSSSSFKIANILTLYSAMVEFQSNNMLMMMSLYSSLFNIDTRYVNSSSTTNTQIFTTTSNHMKKSIIPELIRLKQLDFGSDFNAQYDSLLSRQSVCQIMTDQNKSIDKCGTNSLSYLNQTVIEYLN